MNNKDKINLYTTIGAATHITVLGIGVAALDGMKDQSGFALGMGFFFWLACKSFFWSGALASKLIG